MLLNQNKRNFIMQNLTNHMCTFNMFVLLSILKENRPHPNKYGEWSNFYFKSSAFSSPFTVPFAILFKKLSFFNKFASCLLSINKNSYREAGISDSLNT